MNNNRRAVVLLVSSFCFPALLHAQMPLVACAPAPHPGETVTIAGEAALIVWEPSTSTEHFIRRASFETSASDFGFLVPTPSEPELGEVSDRVFDSLAEVTAPREVTQTVTTNVFGFGDFLPRAREMPKAVGAMASGPPPAASVEVLREQEVAGFDATVLRADDSKALMGWLESHGYDSRPALLEWLRWYTDHGWIITAFKMSKKPHERGFMQTKAVRMTFKAEKPFYPYREPEDMRTTGAASSRDLRLFFLADRIYEGTLGANARWPGSTIWANSSAPLLASIQRRAPEFAKYVNGTKSLTEFVDTSHPRPGTDEVYFRPSADQSTRERPPIVHYEYVERELPGTAGTLAILALVLLGVPGFLFWKVRSGVRKTKTLGEV